MSIGYGDIALVRCVEYIVFAFSVRSSMAIFLNLSAASAVRCPRVAAEERFEEPPGLLSKVRWRPACPSTTTPARLTIPPQLRCLPPLELLVDHVHLLRRYRPVRFEEYIVGILCQIVGGITWVNVIGCVCSTLFKGHPAVERFEEHTALLNMVMSDTSTPIFHKLTRRTIPASSSTLPRSHPFMFHIDYAHRLRRHRPCALRGVHFLHFLSDRRVHRPVQRCRLRLQHTVQGPPCRGALRGAH